jgi:hypothetical protein
MSSSEVNINDLWRKNRQYQETVFVTHETTYDDLKIDLATARTGGTAPTFENVFSNLYAYDFTTLNDTLYFSCQLPHCWKEGTTIYPHLHFLPQTTLSTGSINFGFEYSIATPMSFFNTTSTTSTATTTFPITDNNKHMIIDFAPIGMANNKISTVLICKLWNRQTENNTKIFALSFDFHYAIDSFGSRTELLKN